MKRTKSSLLGDAPILKARIAASAARRMARVERLLTRPERLARGMGLPLPPTLPALAEEEAFPRNLPNLPYGRLRKELSKWTAYYGYAAVQSGIAKGQVLVLESFVTRRKAILFERFKPEKKTSDWSEAIQGRIYSDPEVKKLETKLANARALAALLDSVVWMYLRYTEACSREITARNNEMETESRDGPRRRRD